MGLFIVALNTGVQIPRIQGSRFTEICCSLYILADGLEKASIPVYIHCEVTGEEAKIAGKLLVDAKVNSMC